MSTKGGKSTFVNNVPSLKYAIIELGGGNNPFYHPNIDAVKSPEVDIVADLREGIPLPDESTDKIFAKDFLEHFDLECTRKLLAECKRVLRPEGTIEFIVPDVALAVKTKGEWNHHLDNIIFGTQKNEFEKHKMWYSADLLGYILKQEGWIDIKIKSFRVDDNWYLEPKFVVTARKA